MILIFPGVVDSTLRRGTSWNSFLITSVSFDTKKRTPNTVIIMSKQDIPFIISDESLVVFEFESPLILLSILCSSFFNEELAYVIWHQCNIWLSNTDLYNLPSLEAFGLSYYHLKFCQIPVIFLIFQYLQRHFSLHSPVVFSKVYYHLEVFLQKTLLAL